MGWERGVGEIKKRGIHKIFFDLIYTGGVVEDDIKLLSPVVGGVLEERHSGH